MCRISHKKFWCEGLGEWWHIAHVCSIQILMDINQSITALPVSVTADTSFMSTARSSSFVSTASPAGRATSSQTDKLRWNFKPRLITAFSRQSPQFETSVGGLVGAERLLSSSCRRKRRLPAKLAFNCWHFLYVWSDTRFRTNGWPSHLQYCRGFSSEIDFGKVV